MTNYTYECFLQDHRAALESMQVPQLYWPTIHHKLLSKVFDAPTKFELGELDYTTESSEEEEDEVVQRELFVSVKVDRVTASDPERYFLLKLEFKMDIFSPWTNLHFASLLVLSLLINFTIIRLFIVSFWPTTRGHLS